jgi:glycerol-3-phosphate acyltransferase PlsY
MSLGWLATTSPAGGAVPWSVAPWLCAGAYALGSIPTGLWVARARGIDIRRVGSGNIGATNVARALGKPWALAVLLVDALKGFLPVFAVAHGLGGSGAAWPAGQPAPAPTPVTLVALVGFFAIVGHMFTFFLRGQGGKGVATSLGVAFGLSPPIALVALGAYVLTFALTRLSSLGSLLGMWTFPVVALVAHPLPAPYVALSLVSAVLVTWRHRDNLRRLVLGQETRS